MGNQISRDEYYEQLDKIYHRDPDIPYEIWFSRSMSKSREIEKKKLNKKYHRSHNPLILF